MTEGAASRYAVAVDADVQTEDPAQGVQVEAGAAAPARPRAGLVRWAPLVVALPGLVAALSVLVQGWVPTTDQAVQMLRIAAELLAWLIAARRRTASAVAGDAGAAALRRRRPSRRRSAGTGFGARPARR